MEHIYAIRGWVEGDSQIIHGVRAIAEQGPCAADWHFTSPDVGHHGFAFFGAVVRGTQQDAVLGQLMKIATEVETDFSDVVESVAGVFHVTCLSAWEPTRIWRFECGHFEEDVIERR